MRGVPINNQIVDPCATLALRYCAGGIDRGPLLAAGGGLGGKTDDQDEDDVHCPTSFQVSPLITFQAAVYETPYYSITGYAGGIGKSAGAHSASAAPLATVSAS